MTAVTTLDDPGAVALEGERIYELRYRSDFECRFPDQFAAIDVQSGQAFVGPFPEDAMRHAISSGGERVLHLIRIGSPSAYRMSFFLGSASADLARAF